MKNSLIILIVVVVIILVAILMTTPTCKNVVSGIFKGQKSKAMAPISQRTVTGVQSTRPKVAEPIAPKPKPKPPQPISVPDPKQNVDTHPFPPHQQTVQPQASFSGPVPSSIPEPQQNIDDSSFPPHQRSVQPQASFPVLSGNLYNLLDAKVDVKANFNISEEELNAMARKYKATHLDVPKPEVIRNRHVTRSSIENAEAVLLQSYINSAGFGQRPDTDQLLTEVMRDRTHTAQNGKKSKVSSSKKSRR
jgi:hypothetical protein